MKFALRIFRDKLLTPFYIALFHVLPLKALAYFVVLPENDNEPLKHRILRHLVGMHFLRAGSIYNSRLAKLPVVERRERAKEVWKSPATDSWGQRAFKYSEIRCSAYAYKVIQDISQTLDRPLRILDLGCNNASSYHCLKFRGIDVGYYCGIDINKRMIKEARERFKDQAGVRFLSLDFLEHLKEESETYDILLDKQVLLYLDQDYLESILCVVSEKRLADRIVFQESILADHYGNDSAIMEMNLSPVTYSHNYDFLMKKFGFCFEGRDTMEIPGKEKILKFWAVAKLSTDDPHTVY